MQYIKKVHLTYKESIISNFMLLLVHSNNVPHAVGTGELVRLKLWIVHQRHRFESLASNTYDAFRYSM